MSNSSMIRGGGSLENCGRVGVILHYYWAGVGMGDRDSINSALGVGSLAKKFIAIFIRNLIIKLFTQIIT